MGGVKLMKWYQNMWFICFSLLLCFPIGLYLLLKYGRSNGYTITEHILIICIFLILNFLLFPKILALQPVVNIMNQEINNKQEITENELKRKIDEISVGLKVTYDDMQDSWIYECPIIVFEVKEAQLMLFVVVDRNYNVMMFDQSLYRGKNWIF